jgi:hypothetical protein
MRPNLAILFAALALPLALACGESSGPTATNAVIEDISEAEILASAHLSDLTEEQRAALAAAFRDARAKIAALRARHQAGELTNQEAMAIARQIHAELLAAIESILTPEQLASHRPPLGGPPPGPHRPPDLGLSEDQLAQINALRQELAAFGRSLAAKVQSGELTGVEARAQMHAALRRFNAAVCAILTAEQQARAPFCGGAGG